MRNNTIQRFSPIEITFHWSQAIPYIVLFFTGVAMLLQRLLGAEVMRHDMLSMIHRVAGIVLIGALLLTLLVSIVLGSFRDLFRKMFKCLSWGLRDLIWLAKTSSNMVEPGKKLRLLRLMSIIPGLTIYSEVPIAYFSIVTLVPGFIASGLAIMLIPGALGLWVVHLALFVLACACLGLHLFRTLLYRRTRLRQAMTVAILGMIAVGAVWAYGHQRLKGQAIELRVHRGADIINPGPLTASHAHDPKLERCTSCHQLFSPTSSEKCFSCHEKIKERIADQSGYHGKLTGQCRTCHTDHIGMNADILNFDTLEFNHNLANFELQGKHRKLPCQKCHLAKVNEDTAPRTKYIGLNFAQCIDCHSDSHLGRFEKSCIDCHSANGWKGSDLIFSHNKDSQFEIDQIHSHLDCASCHKDIEAVLFRPLPTTCEKCHDNIEKLSYGIANKISSKPDPHAGRVTCTQCHQTDKQRQKPAEYANKCKSCHNEKYEQLYYDWSKVFDKHALQAEKLLLKLSDEDAPQSTHIAERVKEVNETGFHNIDLANKLWNQIFSETPLSNE